MSTPGMYTVFPAGPSDGSVSGLATANIPLADPRDMANRIMHVLLWEHEEDLSRVDDGG